MTVYVGDRRLTTAEHHELMLAGLRAQGLTPCPACFAPLARVGDCRGCRTQKTLDSDPDYSAMADAQARLDDDLVGSLDEVFALERVVAGFWRKVEQAEWDVRTEVNACGAEPRCRRAERDHMLPGWRAHEYVQPSDALRLRRMYAHRAARLGLPLWSRPGAR